MKNTEVKKDFLLVRFGSSFGLVKESISTKSGEKQISKKQKVIFF